MSDPEILFEGLVQPSGGISNDWYIANSCPDEFQLGNPWTNFAERVFIHKADSSTWKFIATDPYVIEDQIAKLKGLFSSLELDVDDKIKSAGWMLSHMLLEIPEHVIPAEDSTTVV